MPHTSRTGHASRDVEELVGRDVAEAGAEHRREEHDDGDAGREEIDRVAVQRVVTTPVRTHKHNASNGAQRERTRQAGERAVHVHFKKPLTVSNTRKTDG